MMVLAPLALACSPSAVPASGGGEAPTRELKTTRVQAPAHLADVQSVRGSGPSGAFTFTVEVASEDLGCEQYADWWEVLRPGGELIYRRTLGHSHVDEQPFTRGGGPVDVKPIDEVIVRAHMNPGGYGGRAMRGSVAKGFVHATLDSSFASGLSAQSPQPSACSF